MSLFPLPKLNKLASTFENLRGRLSTRKSLGTVTDRVQRKLAVDPLEERQLLSVSPSTPYDQWAAQDGSTIAGQSIAVDDDGDFVVVYSSDGDIYARYFTDETQRISLPESMGEGTPGSWGTIDLRIGGNEVQKLSVTTTVMPFSGGSSGAEGSFTIGYDIDGDGSIDPSSETMTMQFDQYDIAGNVTRLQTGLQALNGKVGPLSDVTVEAINSEEYLIKFGDASQGQNMDALQIDPANTVWTSGDLPAAIISTESEPLVLTGVPVDPNDPQLTALYIQDCICNNEYYPGVYDWHQLGPSDFQTYEACVDSANPNFFHGYRSPGEYRYANWEAVVRPVDLDGDGVVTDFDVTFTGAAGKMNVEEIVIETAINPSGDDVTAEINANPDLGIRTIKEPSAPFQVNDLDWDNPMTPWVETSYESRPAVAMDADGDFVITWQSNVEGSAGLAESGFTDIYARRFSPTQWDVSPSFVMHNGTAIQCVVPYGNQFLVNSVTAGHQDQPAVGMDADGNFTIAWVNSSQELSFYNRVSAQRYNRDGDRIGGEFVVVDFSGDTDTDIHYDPYVAMSDDGHLLFTWSETNDRAFYEKYNNPGLDNWYFSTVWAKLYDPDFTLIGAPEPIDDLCEETTASFDSQNNFVISGSSFLDDDDIKDDLNSSGVRAVTYTIAEDETTGERSMEVLHSTFRANSSSMNPDTKTIWPGNQYNGQALIDADGDVTIVYNGFGPEVSWRIDSSTLSRTAWGKLANSQINSDLVSYLETYSYAIYDDALYGNSTKWALDNFLAACEGDMQADPAFKDPMGILDQAKVDETLGRLRAIAEQSLLLLEGEANGVMYSNYHALYNSTGTCTNPLEQNSLGSDVIVNSKRDGSDAVMILSYPKDAATGSLTVKFGINGEEYGLTPEFGDGGIDIDATRDLIEEAIEAYLEEHGFREYYDVEPCTVAVNYLDPAGLRDGTQWECVPTKTVSYSITIMGEHHNVGLFMVPGSENEFEDAAGGILGPAGITDYSYADRGTAQYSSSAGITPSGDFVVAWTEASVGGVSNIYFREFEEVSDHAGPKVTDFILPDGERLEEGGQVESHLNQIVVTMDEAMLADGVDGVHSVLNPNNWALLKDGVQIGGGVTQVLFGMNMGLESGLSTSASNKWEAVLTLDGNGYEEGGDLFLADGSYTIVARNEMRDMSENPLAGSGHADNGYDMERSFSVSLPTGTDTVVNDQRNDVQTNLDPDADNIPETAFPSSPQTIAGDADGECVVVWVDENAGHEGVYAKVYPVEWHESTDGERYSSQGTPISITVTDNPDAEYASVARDGDGDFVVTWSQLDGSNDWNIYCRRFDAMGNALSDPVCVNSCTEGEQRFSKIAMDIDGDFVITWQSLGQDESGYSVYAQSFSSDGERLCGLDEIKTIEFAGGVQSAEFALRFMNEDGSDRATTERLSYDGDLLATVESIELAAAAKGIAVEVWKLNETTIAIQFVGAEGLQDQPPILFDGLTFDDGDDPEADVVLATLVEGEISEFRVNDTTAGDQLFPSIAMDSQGNFVITWTSFGQDGDQSYESNVYARQFSSEKVYNDILGENLTQINAEPEFKVNTTVDGNQKWSSVAMDVDGDFVISWTGFNQDGGGDGNGSSSDGLNGVFAQRFNSNAYKVGPEFQVNEFTQADQQHSQVSMDANGDFMIVWESFQQRPNPGTGPDSPITYGVYAQRYVRNEVLGFSTPGIGDNGEQGGQVTVNSWKEGDQRFPSVSLSDTGDAYVTWVGPGQNDLDGGIFLKRYEKVSDDAGAMVTEVAYVGEGSVVKKVDSKVGIETSVTQFVVTFGEDLSTKFEVEGDHSVLNLDNWELRRNGVTIVGAIDSIDFGYNSETGKFEAIVTLNTEVTSVGDQLLRTGNYELILKEAVEDLFANPFDGDLDGNPGGDFQFTFMVGGSASDDPINPDDPSGGSGSGSGYTHAETANAVAVDADGNYVVVWTQETADGERVYFQQFDSVGTSFCAPTLVHETTANEDQCFASVSSDADGDFVVTWTSYDNADGGQADIYARRFDNAGEAIDEQAFLVNTFVNFDQQWSDVAMDVDGDFVIVWSSYGQEKGGQTGLGNGIYGRRFDSNGIALGQEFQVNTTTAGDQKYPSVAVGADLSDDGMFVVVWQSEQNGKGSDIIGRTFYQNGAPVMSPYSGEFLVNDTTAGNQIMPDVAIKLDASTFVVTWSSQDGIGDDSGYGVYTKAFDALTDKEQTVRYDYQGNPIDIVDGRVVSDYPFMNGEVYGYEVVIGVDQSFVIEDLDVRIDVSHQDPSDLWCWLVGPAVYDEENPDADPTYPTILLFSGVPTSGDAEGYTDSGYNGVDFRNTTFDDEALISIDDDESGALPPFEGSYQPIDSLSYFDGMNAVGEWRLVILDNDPLGDPDVYDYDYGRIDELDSGRLLDWGLTFTRNSAISPESLVNSTTMGNQMYSSIAMDYAGNYVVTWCGYGDQEDEEDTSQYGVFLQEFSAAGSRTGGETRVNNSTKGMQWLASVGADANGNYVVAWTGDIADSQTQTGVYHSASASVESKIDLIGPIVSQVADSEGNSLRNGGVVNSESLNQMIVTFSENMSQLKNADGQQSFESVENPENWMISKGGSPIVGGITEVDFNFNPETEQFEATLTFKEGLAPGRYELTVLDTMTDLAGNRLDGDFDGTPATDTSESGSNGYTMAFYVADGAATFGPEILVNGNQELIQVLAESSGYTEYAAGQGQQTSVRSTAIDDNGDFVVVWSEYAANGTSDVYFQMFNVDGTQKGEPVLVNKITAGNQLNASVAMDAAGDFTVVWESTNPLLPNSGLDIYAQRFNADGTRVLNDTYQDRIDEDPIRAINGFDQLVAQGAIASDVTKSEIETLVNTDWSGQQFNAEVAMDSYGNTVIVWTSSAQSFSYFEGINAQIYDIYGRPSGEEIQVSESYQLLREDNHALPGATGPGSSAAFRSNPSVAMSDDGQFVVAWDDMLSQSNGIVMNTTVMAKVFSLNGHSLTPKPFEVDMPGTEISDDDGSVPGDTYSGTDEMRAARNPQVAMDGDGDFVIVYEAYRDNDIIDYEASYGIYYQYFDMEKVGPGSQDVTISFATDFVQQANEVWSAQIEDVDESYLYISETSYDLYEAYGLDQVNPSVSMDANGNFAIVWNGNGAVGDPLNPGEPDYLSNEDSSGVFIRWFHASDGQPAAPLDTAQRVNMTSGGIQELPTVAMNRNGDAVVSWSGAGVGDEHGIFARQYVNTADTAGPMPTELYLPTPGSEDDDAAFLADGDTAFGSVQQMYVVFNEEMNTLGGADGLQSILNVDNWAIVNGAGQELQGVIESVDFELNESLNKWVATVNFTSPLPNGTYELVARTEITDVAGHMLGRTGHRIDGTGEYGNDVSSLVWVKDEIGGYWAFPALEPFTSPRGGFAFNFNVNDTIPGDPVWGTRDEQVNQFDYGKQCNSTIARAADGSYVVSWVDYTPVGVVYYTADAQEGENGELSAGSYTIDVNGEEFTIDTRISKPKLVYEADIKAQRFDFWGREIGDEILINSITTGDQVEPDVAIDDDGNFVVVWSGTAAVAYDASADVHDGEGTSNDNNLPFSFGDLGVLKVDWLVDRYDSFGNTTGKWLVMDETGVFAQRFDSDGETVGGQFMVNETTHETQSQPAVAMNPGTGDFVVTWNSYEQDGSQGGIVARAFNRNAVGGDEFLVNTLTAGMQQNPDIAIDREGDYVITWESENVDSAGYGIVARRFDANHNSLGNQFRVNESQQGNQVDPAIACDDLGNFVVAWETADGSGFGISAKLYNRNGGVTKSEFRVNEMTEGAQIDPAVAMSSGHGFVVTWTSFGQDDFLNGDPDDTNCNDYGIYARMFNDNGSDYVDDRVSPSRVGEFRVNAEVEGDQVESAVAMDASGYYMVTWTGPNRHDKDYEVVITGADIDLADYVIDYSEGSGVDYLYTPSHPSRGVIYGAEAETEVSVNLGWNAGSGQNGDSSNEDLMFNASGTFTTLRQLPDPLRYSYPAPGGDGGDAGDDNEAGDGLDYELANLLLDSESTSIYSRLIDPPPVAVDDVVEEIVIQGTSGNDTIEFLGGPSSNGWIVKVNGAIREIGSNVKAIRFDGLGGGDTFVFHGSGADDVIDLAADGSSFASENYTITVDGFETVLAEKSGGNDLVTLHDSTGNDTLVANPGETTMTGSGVTLIAEGFDSVVAVSENGGSDTAKMYDSVGADTFTSYPTLATIDGNGYHVSAEGFRYVMAYSEAGGNDQANLYDGAETDDTLVANSRFVTLSNENFYTIANGFRYASATSTGGDDVARLYDSAGDDTFEARADYAKFYGDDYYLRADNFGKVFADASAGGHNVANLYGSEGDDLFVAGPNYGKLMGEGFDVRADSFEVVTGYGVGGGNDIAMLYDSAGDDTLNVTSVYGELLGDGFSNRAYGFNQVEALSVNGGVDKAALYDSALSDRLDAEGDWVQLSNEELDFVYKAVGFNEVKANSSNEGDEKKVAADVDFLFALGLWEDAE